MKKIMVLAAVIALSLSSVSFAANQLGNGTNSNSGANKSHGGDGTGINGTGNGGCNNKLC